MYLTLIYQLFLQGESSGSGGRPSRPNLRDNFVPASAHRDFTGQPRRGPIIFVRGSDAINEEFLRDTFTKASFRIIHINMEFNKRKYVCQNGIP